MIRKIKFSNFYSFKDEQEIDFLVSKKKSYSYAQSQVNKNSQITKIAGFIGSNASGKTNIMRLFSFLGFFVCNEQRLGNLDVGFKTFFNNKEKSIFNIEFEIEDNLYFYRVEFKDNIILKESLAEKKSIKNARKKNIFLRNEDNINSLDSIYFKDFPIKYLKNIRPDVSLIAFLRVRYDIEIVNKIFQYFSNIYININEVGERNHLAYNIRSVETYLEDNDIKNEMEEFIRCFDVGVDGIDIRKEKGADDTFITTVFAKHLVDEKQNLISFDYESMGTKALFVMLAPIMSALKNDGIVIIDEIEMGLHPEAVIKIISYFIDENENGKSQLIFSSHALDFLKSFDMQQIFLVNKDMGCSSTLHRLDSVEGIRSDENFLAHYMSGEYGAFPNIKV